MGFDILDVDLTRLFSLRPDIGWNENQPKGSEDWKPFCACSGQCRSKGM